MAKKKGGSKKKSSSGSNKDNVVEIQPEPEEMSLLYRKARFDDPSHSLSGELRVQYDGYHREVTKGYCEFLRQRNFWMTGDEIPDGVIPSAPAVKSATSTSKKGKKK